MNKQLILLQKKIALKKLPSIIHDNDLCYFLSKDYSSYLRLNGIIPDNCKVLNLAGKFNRQIERLRIPYLDLFARLNKQYNSLEWWCSHIASKQSASTPLPRPPVTLVGSPLLCSSWCDITSCPW